MSGIADRRPGHPGAWGQLLEEARNGSGEALGRLWEASRQYLLLVANQQLAPELRDKVGPSDVVQDTFLEAQRDFGRFHGVTEHELLAWLRAILLHNLANVHRSYHDTGKRRLNREVPFDEVPPRELVNGLASRADSPGARLVAREEAERLDRALGQLPEHYRRVILLHHRDGLTFEAVGAALGKSAEAARKLWVRALEQLEAILEPPDEPR